MFGRLVYQSFRRQQRRKLLAGAAVTLGVAVATAMIAVATDIGDKVSRELRSYGANIIVYPQEDTLDVRVGGVNLKPATEGAFLKEADLPAIKSIFWWNNIVGFAPVLPAQIKLENGPNAEFIGTYFSKEVVFGPDRRPTGVRVTHPWWKVRGAWPSDDSNEVLIGEKLARQLRVEPDVMMRADGTDLKLVGILSTGGAEDNTIVGSLSLAQQFLRRPGAVRRVLVSAATKPEDELARRNPKTMSPADYDRWYCSPYVSSIAHQLKEVIPGSEAEQIRQVAQNEGVVLSRIQGLMLLVTLAALVASALAVSAAMATTILERRGEVGLMKAIGASNAMVGSVFFAEAVLLALIGGAAGFFAGSALALRIGQSVFGSSIHIQPVLFPIILTLAVAVTFGGSAPAIRQAVKYQPSLVLRGGDA
jgi:putative ABC transport system permease protein